MFKPLVFHVICPHTSHKQRFQREIYVFVDNQYPWPLPRVRFFQGYGNPYPDPYPHLPYPLPPGVSKPLVIPNFTLSTSRNYVSSKSWMALCRHPFIQHPDSEVLGIFYPCYTPIRGGFVYTTVTLFILLFQLKKLCIEWTLAGAVPPSIYSTSEQKQSIFYLYNSCHYAWRAP